MTGADIIGALLRENPPIVPTDRIKGGRLPDGVELPALLVRIVSSVERQTLKRGQTTRTIDRVSVTVRAASYREANEILAKSRARCAGRVGDIADAKRVSILTAGRGPDVNGPGNSFEGTQDFRVSFDAEV